MINTSKSELVFLQSGDEFLKSVKEAFADASQWILQAYQLQGLDLRTVSTKSFSEAAFPAHIEEFVLTEKAEIFDEDYVCDVLRFVSMRSGQCTYELYGRVINNPEVTGPGNGGFRKSYFEPLKRGFSVFLIALHIRRAIVLPFFFKWPRGYFKDRSGRIVCRRELIPFDALPELLRLIRSVEYRNGAVQTEPVFEAYNSIQRERLVWMGQRILVAAGWLELADANYDDLLALKVANEDTGFTGHADLGLLMLSDLLGRKYGKDSPINGDGWRAVLMTSRPVRALQDLENSLGKGNSNLIQIAASQNPSTMEPGALAELKVLPGLEMDLKGASEVWLKIERSFLRKFKLESKKSRVAALGYWNIYLFGYLAYWYAANPGFEYDFPSSPQKLVAAVFVSDLGLLEGRQRPMPFVEFLMVVGGIREWSNTSHYAILKQVELLFAFIERYGDSLPSSDGFRQPLHRHDYPRSERSSGTRKRPIPRKVFKLFLSLSEALAELSKVIFERVLAGEVAPDYLARFSREAKTIDCMEHQDQFGFVPLVWYQGKAFPLWEVPNVFGFGRRLLKNGLSAMVPHPHALHQIVVSLYTGLRQNHIQWLDRISFDRHLADVEAAQEFAELYVNTDKVKMAGWRPFVNFRVIEILRLQRDWCEEIAVQGFANKIYYNKNLESKFGKILPLFAYYADGSPHSDDIYSACWMRLLSALQGMLVPITGKDITLFRLLPRGIDFGAPDLEHRLREYGASQSERCAIFPKSDITPHSARVSVVSQAISILPADLIGRYWTGEVT
ncbi:hypothetical protein [Massilia eburnea]|uniref:hypothetical protein n=1 Tax=Massilia eburnea TaxID=1776165 RepID=UPI003D6C0FA9